MINSQLKNLTLPTVPGEDSTTTDSSNNSNRLLEHGHDDVNVDEEIAVVPCNNDDPAESISAQRVTRPGAFHVQPPTQRRNNGPSIVFIPGDSILSAESPTDNDESQEAHVELAPTCPIAWAVDDDVRLAVAVEDPEPTNNDPPRDDSDGDSDEDADDDNDDNVNDTQDDPIKTITICGKATKRSTFILIVCFSATVIMAIIAPVSIIYASVRNDENDTAQDPVTSPPKNETENEGYNLTNEMGNLPNNDIATNNQQNAYIGYLNSIFSTATFADPDRCRNGYAPVCGDCWCGMDDNEQNATCPPFPDGFVDGCTDTERRLRLLSVYKKYIREEVPANDYSMAHLNTDRLPSLRPIPTDPTVLTLGFRVESPLLIDVSEDRDGSDMTACNPFGADMHNNPFRDLPNCFSFPGERSDNAYNESEAVCAFKVTGTTSYLGANDLDDTEKTSIDGACGERGETTYVLQTLSSADSAVNDASLQIVHDGPCGQCSTAQDLVTLLDNPDSFYASSIACILGSVMTSESGTIYGQSTLFPVYYSCYRSLGISEGCSIALASVIFGTSFCDQTCTSSLCERTFQDGDARHWLGGPPPTCEKHDCDTCMDDSNMFGLSSILGPYHQTGRSVSSVLVDHAYKCQNFEGVDTDKLILDPCGDFENT